MAKLSLRAFLQGFDKICRKLGLAVAMTALDQDMTAMLTGRHDLFRGSVQDACDLLLHSVDRCKI